MEKIDQKQQTLVSDFKACCNIADDEKSIAILKSHQWNYQAAVLATLDVASGQSASDNVQASRDSKHRTSSRTNVSRMVQAPVYDLLKVPGSGLISSVASFLGGIVSSILPGVGSKPNDASFLYELQKKYGKELVPPFATGSFQEPLKLSKQENKLILVYLHSALHQDTDDFCSNLLCTEQFTSFLDDKFLCWAGDVRYNSGYRMSQVLKAEAFPFVCLLDATVGSDIKVIFRNSGIVEVDALISNLTVSLNTHQEQINQETLRRLAEAQDRELRAMQDREYQQVLAADKAASEKKKEEERLQQIEQERKKQEEMKRIRESKQREELNRAKANARELLKSKLPAEPADNAPGVTQVCIRLPDGEKLVRNFLLSQTMQIIFAFISTHELRNSDGEEVGKYMVVTTFPRKVYTNPSATLKSLGFGRREVLVVEEVGTGGDSKNTSKTSGDDNSHNNNNNDDHNNHHNQSGRNRAYDIDQDYHEDELDQYNEEDLEDLEDFEIEDEDLLAEFDEEDLEALEEEEEDI